MSEYKYYISSFLVSPLNKGTLEFSYERNSAGGMAFSVTLESEVVFHLTDGGFDFDAQESNGLCHELPFRIYRKCGSTFALFWQGIFSVSEGSFDRLNGTFAVKPRKRKMLMEDILVNIFDDPEAVIEGGVTGVTMGSSTLQRTYPARYFDKLLLYIARKSNPDIAGVVSDFFQINPVTVSANCLPGVPNYYTKMVFCAMSDVVEPLPSNPAIIELVTFGSIMADLCVLFDVFWFIDDNNNLRIEHSTYYDTATGIDLTVSRYAAYNRTEKYSYDLEDFPKKETWKIHGHRQTVNFLYTGLCDLVKSENNKIFSTKVISTGYRQRFQGDTDPNEGLLLVATDGGSTSSFWRMLESSGENFRLTPDFLAQNILTYNRPDIYAIYTAEYKDIGQVTSGGKILSSVRATRSQEPITFPLCCDDDFDPTKRIKTRLGVGYVQKASFSQKTGNITVELKYKVSNCGILTPTAIEGCALWLQHQVGISHDAGAVGSLQNVNQWSDQSGNGRHATQSVIANKPKYLVGSGSPIMFEATGGPTVFTNLVTPSFSAFPSKRGTIITLIDRDELSSYSSADDSTGIGPLTSPGFNGMTIVSTNAGAPNANDFDVSLDGLKYYSENLTQQLYPQNSDKNGLFVIRRGADTSMYTRQNSIQSYNNPIVIPNSTINTAGLVIGPNGNIGTVGGFLLIKEVIVYDRELSDAEVEAIEFYFVKQGYYKLY